MDLTQHLTIDNSLESAIKSGSARKMPAKFHKKLMNKVEWKELLEETYLSVWVRNIQDEEDDIALYDQYVGCYPHHAIQHDKLVLHIPRLKKGLLGSS